MNILVYLEERNGQIRKPSLEAITAAQSLGGSTSAVVVSADAAVAEAAAKLGVRQLYVVNDSQLSEYSARATAKAIAAVAKIAGAEVVLLGATQRGKDLGPRVGIRLEAGYVPDIIALSSEGGTLIATRPVYAGKALTTVKVTTPTKVYSTRPNLWKAASATSTPSNLSPQEISFEPSDWAAKTTALTLSQGKLDVAEADIIVSGGRGLRGPEHWTLIENLASALGAATGASRAVVDAGWRSHEEQVGQTGKTVSPTMYVAVGISGAVQHLAGMSSSKTIVAINKDENAPIFSIADYGIVGDAFEILPPLTEEIKRLKAH